MPNLDDKSPRRPPEQDATGTDGVPAGDAPAENGGEERATWWRVLRGFLIGLGSLVGGVIVLVLLVLLALQFNWGAKKAGDAIIGLANPFDEATISVGDIDGNWITNLQLHDVAITRDDTVRMARVDTLRLRYNLLALLRGTIHVREAYAADPWVRMTQRADSTWDLLDALAQDTTAADTTAAAFTFRVDQLRLRDGSFAARYYAPTRDSTLYIRDLNTRLDSLVIDEGTALLLNELRAEVTPPGSNEPAHVLAEGSFANGRLIVDAFALDSPESTVRAEGRLILPQTEDAPIEDIDFTLTAEPLSFRDLYPFVPTLDPTGSATLDARVTGTSALLDATVEGTFSDGSSIDLDATLTPGAEGPLTYQIDGQVRQINPAFFLGDPTTEGRITADLQADLEGTSLDQLNGTAHALFTDTRYGEYFFNRALVAARFDDGQATLDVETALRGTQLAVSGSIRPFAETPTYDLRGQISNFDLGAFSEEGTQSSDITGSFRLAGSGFDPQTADATATIELAPSRVNQYEVNDGTLTARLNDGALSFDTELTFPEGQIAAEGTAHFDDPLRYRISEGRFTNLDVAALTGDTTRSSLTGTFSLQGRGTDPATDLRLNDLHLTLSDSYYDTYAINQAVLNGTLISGRLTLDAVADLQGGSFDVAGTLRPFDDVPAFTITRSTFQDVNVGELTGNPDQTSDLSGRIVHLTGRGFDPQTMTLDTRLELTESQYNQQQIDSALVDAQLRGGVLDFDAALETPEGLTNLAGTLDFSGEELAFALNTGTLNGFNLGALLGIEGLDTSLNGTFEDLTLRGSDLQTMTLHARLTLDRSQVNAATIVDGEAEVALEDGLARVGATLSLEQGAATFQASGRFFDERPTYEAFGSFQNVDVGALAGVDTLNAGLSAEFGVQGEGFDPETMQLQARLDAAEAYYDSVQVRTLATRFHLSDGLLTVDTLAVRSNVADVEAGGQIAVFDSLGAYPSDFTFDAEIGNLSPLRAFIPAEVFTLDEGSITARVYGPRGRLLFDADLSLTSLVYNDFRVAGLEATTTGRMQPGMVLDIGELRAEAQYLSTPALTAQDARVEADYANEELSFDTRMTIDERRDARLRGAIDLRPDNQRILIEDLALRFDQDRWELLQPTAITYGEAYRVSGFLLYTGNQQIALDGVIDLDGEQNLALTIEQFRIGAVADLLDFEGLDGTLNGSLALTGPAEAPNMDGTLNFDVISFEEGVGDLRMDVRYDSLRLNLDAELTHTDGSTLTLDGYVPMDLRLREPDRATEQGVLQVRQQQAGLGGEEVDLTLTANQFNVGWIEPFLDPEVVDQVEGKLTGDISIGGTVDTPILDGEAMLTDGRLSLPELNVTYTNARIDAELAENQVLINHAEVRSGDGSLIAEGTVNLSELTLGEFDIEASAEDFRAINTNEYQADVSADLRLTGTTNRPVLEGDVRLLSADILLTDETTAAEFEPVELTEQDVQMLERNFGVRVTEADTSTFDFYQALAMDLDVEMERDVWLRSRQNPNMVIQFTGQLDLQKQAYQDQQLFGNIEVIPERSYISQFGRRFDIESGTLSFNGPATDPYFNIQAAYDVRSRTSRDTEIVINLAVTGRLDDLNLELSSDPSTDMTNIVSYLATGQPADKAFQLGGARELGTDLALNQLANIVEGAAGTELGLDVIEIRQEGLQGTTITAGKYVSRRLFASVSWPISFNNTQQNTNARTSLGGRQFMLEYELFNWLLARLTSDGSTIRVNLLYEYAY